MKSATATIDLDGKMNMETAGYQGPACDEAIKRILEEMRRLGAEPDVTEKTAKPEFYAIPTGGNQYGNQF